MAISVFTVPYSDDQGCWVMRRVCAVVLLLATAALAPVASLTCGTACDKLSEGDAPFCSAVLPFPTCVGEGSKAANLSTLAQRDYAAVLGSRASVLPPDSRYCSASEGSRALPAAATCAGL